MEKMNGKKGKENNEKKIKYDNRKWVKSFIIFIFFKCFFFIIFCHVLIFLLFLLSHVGKLNIIKTFFFHVIFIFILVDSIEKIKFNLNDHLINLSEWNNCNVLKKLIF